MVWYVALVAVLNIGLGYALAVYVAAARERNLSTDSAAESTSYEEFDDGDEYYSDEHDVAAVEETEFESAIAG